MAGKQTVLVQNKHQRLPTNRYTEIYRGTDASYAKTSLTTSGQYKFRVAVANDVGRSDLSEALNVTLCGVPTVPTSLQVTYRSGSMIKLQWQRPLVVGGCPIEGYVPKLNGVALPEQLDTEYWIDPATPGRTRTAQRTPTRSPVYLCKREEELVKKNSFVYSNISFLQILLWLDHTQPCPGTAYQFAVQARSAGGRSSFTQEVAIVAALAPGKISPAPTITSSDQYHVGLSWTQLSTSEEGGSPILFYRVFRNNGLGGSVYVPFNDTTNKKPEVTTIRLSTEASKGSDYLVAGRQYCFTVAAMNLVSWTNALNDQSPAQSDPVCSYTAGPPDPPATIYFKRVIKVGIL